MTASASVDPVRAIAQADWFPVDLDVGARRWRFLRLDVDTVQRSTFMDDRLDADLSRAVAVDADLVAEALRTLPKPAHVPGWLFHTSFCGSTLLARALHVPPAQVALKEPLILRRLGDARHAGQAIGDLTTQAAALLSRPWHSGAGVAIKPTHAALNVAGELMAASSRSRALVLTSSLDDFLVSNLKKPRQTQAKLPQLAERALQGTALLQRLPGEAFQPPDLLCAAALQWAGQRDRIGALVAELGEDRVRVLQFDQWVAEVTDTAVECSRWLRLPASPEMLRARAEQVAAIHAKATSVTYGRRQRAAEIDQVRAAYGEPLQRASAWAARHVLPALQAPLPPREGLG